MPLIEAGVAMHFGQDGGGRDRPAASVAIDERQLLDGKFQSQGINQQIVRLNGQGLHGPAHGQAGGLIDVDLVDFENIGGAISERASAFLNLASQGSRSSTSRILLSFRPRMGASGSSTTAAAKTGPKRQPRPTSSTPAMH